MVDAAPEAPTLARPLVIQTDEQPWARSPSPMVWRKRLEHSGPAEAGRVTSLVRYEAGSAFASHEHPDGEEILVLDGTFADEHDSYPAGTFLLNPEGFAHAPRCADGCLLFVKLRQSPGPRRGVRIDTRSAPFTDTGSRGVSRLELHAEPGFPEIIELFRMAPGSSLGPLSLGTGAAALEVLVLEGACRDGQASYGPRTWLRFFPGAPLNLVSVSGGLLYVKRQFLPLTAA
jgi:quercetin dioxygenase-like cupin family protein